MLSSLRTMSWQVTAVLGLAVLAVALQLSRTGQDIEAVTSRARAAGQPKAVTLADFDPAQDIHIAGEVHVVVRIDPKRMLTIAAREQTSTDAYATYVRRLFILKDPKDRGDSTLVRGAILLPDDQVGRFLELVAETRSDTGRRGDIVALNGVTEARPPLADAALAELAALGLETDGSFLFLTPFLQGREVAFQPRDGSWRRFVSVIAGLGSALLVLAIAKRVTVIKGARDPHGTRG